MKLNSVMLTNSRSDAAKDGLSSIDGRFLYLQTAVLHAKSNNLPAQANSTSRSLRKSNATRRLLQC